MLVVESNRPFTVRKRDHKDIHKRLYSGAAQQTCPSVQYHVPKAGTSCVDPRR